ncbi:NUDIX domain-containing protein [Mesobacillus sp. AQ2]|uniref:NUDIX domain-containing protein n=1 Tax=Bacillaceae TaxID=186817 RepID=UPI0011A5BC4C|nr:MULTISPECIES: NUDIX domain-containing protein [Bacillaceae]MCM3122850.1 NUDIX domain-containing protein [Mesobacillus sp. MER 33]MCM3233667.1 NUDIX domain-containing protein [Mesobacillus sp. MER 48]WHX42723.1 NUDIX domain-containing protein [Mesobacillus sp. AQ2]
MNFNLELDEQNLKSFLKTIDRVAIRAIIMKNNRILLVESNWGDYKFPGGGLEENETHEDCLKREVREETGYVNSLVKDKVGIVIERKMDEYEDHTLFQMTSHYYLCELATDEKVTQQLDDYEAKMDFTAKWVTLEEAIIQNESLINNLEKNSWLKRETFVLKHIKEMHAFRL